MFRLTITFALLGCALAGVIEPRYSDDLGGRIVGGEATEIDRYPYQVALLKDGSLFCGGSLYSSDIIVTAAHCLQSYSANQIQVRLGSTTYKSGGELIQATAFRFHEKYDSKLMINDVGIIKLGTPVRYTDKIQPIALAKKVPPTGTPAVVSGWGTNKFLIGSIQSNLQVVDVDIVDVKDCASDTYKYGSQILDTMVCAASEGGGKDACQGDSGGPLAALGELVGIVSWGNMCARDGYPGVYAAVPDLAGWIEVNAADL